MAAAPPPDSLIARARTAGVADEVTCKSVLNRVNLDRVLADTPLSMHERTALQKLKRSADKSGAYAVTLTERRKTGEPRTDCGRVYSTDYSTACASTMRSPVRAALLGDWVEADIVCCHPTILANYARWFRIQAPELNAYISDRNATLQRVGAAFRLPPSAVKVYYNAALYGSRVCSITGDDGVPRDIHVPWAEGGAHEAARAELSAYICEVERVCRLLLANADVRRQHSINLKRVEYKSDASKLNKLLEVGERCAIHALLTEIDASASLLSGEVIFDGVLVGRKDGAGRPDSADLNALCAAAAARAKSMFDLDVSFAAKPMQEGDIFAVDSGSACAVLQHGRVLYVPNAEASEEVAQGLAARHGTERGHRHVVALQSRVGARYGTAAHWGALEASLRKLRGDRRQAAWEVVPSDKAVRAFAVLVGAEEDAATAVAAYSQTISRLFGGQLNGGAPQVIATIDGSGHLVLVCATLVLPNLDDVAQLAHAAFRGTPLADRVQHTDRVLVLGQTAIGDSEPRRRVDGSREWEPCCLSPPPGAVAADVTALDAEVESATVVDRPLVRWSAEYLDAVRAVMPAEVVEEDLPQLVMRFSAPGKCAHTGDLDSKRVMQAVARALWASASSEETEAGAKVAFTDWVTGDSENSAAHAEGLWVDVTAAADSGVGSLEASREMLDVVRHRVPELYTAYVVTATRAATSAPVPGDASPCAWMDVQHHEAVPGPGSIGSLNALMKSYKYTGLVAPPGFGKTDGLNMTVRERPPESALALSTRKAAAASFMSRYNVVDAAGQPVYNITWYHYQDESVDRCDVDHLICELESIISLHRRYSLLILDEFMSIIMQVASHINRSRFQRLAAALRRLCADADHVVCMDALMTLRAFKRFIEIVEGPSHRVRATMQVYHAPPPPAGPDPRTAVLRSKRGRFTPGDLRLAISERFAANTRRLFVFTNIQSLLKTIESEYKKCWEVAHAAGQVPAPEPRVLLLDKSEYAKCQKEARDVDTWWSGYDLVAVSPTVTNAVSFNVQGHFDAVLGFATNMSSIAPDVLQGLIRVRYPADRTIYVYVAATTNGRADAVKTHFELQERAKRLHRPSSELEKFCYAEAGRAQLLSFNFFEDYLAACFRASAFAVERGARLPVTKPEPLIKPDAVAPPAFESVPRVQLADFAGKLVPALRKEELTPEEAATVLERLGVPPHAEAETEPDNAAEAPAETRDDVALLKFMVLRFKFAHDLLAIQGTGGVENDMALTGEQSEAVAELWKEYCTDKDRGELWAARKAFLYEFFSPRLGDGAGGFPEHLRKEFADSAKDPWVKKFSVVRRALGFVGMCSAVPNAAQPALVTRETLAGALADLDGLIPDFNDAFGKSHKRLAVAATASVSDKAKAAATLFREIVGAWNPRITFKASNKRKRDGEGGFSRENQPYQLRFAIDCDGDRQKMELLHAANLRAAGRTAAVAAAT